MPRHPNPQVLTIIVPIFNEERTVGTSLRSLCRLALAKQVVAVDDGSGDNSSLRLREWAKAGGGTAIFHETNRGKGHAIRGGLTPANGEFVVIQDADLEYDPTDLPKLLPPL